MSVGNVIFVCAAVPVAKNELLHTILPLATFVFVFDVTKSKLSNVANGLFALQIDLSSVC